MEVLEKQCHTILLTKTIQKSKKTLWGKHNGNNWGHLLIIAYQLTLLFLCQLCMLPSILAGLLQAHAILWGRFRFCVIESSCWWTSSSNGYNLCNGLLNVVDFPLGFADFTTAPCPWHLLHQDWEWQFQLLTWFFLMQMKQRPLLRTQNLCTFEHLSQWYIEQIGSKHM